MQHLTFQSVLQKEMQFHELLGKMARQQDIVCGLPSQLLWC